jgi:large subunit ribosomal protein L16
MATRGSHVSFGEFGLQATTNGWFSAKQIEAARKTITHSTKRMGKLWVRIFPDKPITKKAAGAKMGSGKGEIEAYVAVVKSGKVLFELSGVTPEIAREAFRKAGHKIPIRTKFIEKV